MPKHLLRRAAAMAALLALALNFSSSAWAENEPGQNLAMNPPVHTSGNVTATKSAAPASLAPAGPAQPSASLSMTIPLPAQSNLGQRSAQPDTGSSKPDDDVPFIDNDEDKTSAEYQWQEIPDADGKTHIQAGARFPVCVISTHTSKNAKVGDAVEGRLDIDIKIGGRLIAGKGATVIGHVINVAPARRMLVAEICPKRWMRAAGALGIQFDEILVADQHIPLVAAPARASRVVNNVNEGRVLGVNQDGQLASPLSIQLKHQALHLAIRAGASAGGVFSFGAVPVAFGVLGALSPSFAYMQPVGKNVRHRRLKGFTMGVVSGLPGGFLISDTIIRGPEAVVKPGDVFLAEFKQDFSGEPSSEAQLLPNVKTKVHGEVLPDEKEKK